MNCCTASDNNLRTSGRARLATDENRVPSPPARGSIMLTRWSLPAVILVLLPKCPACLAAYIALGTGVSLSVTTSSYLRLGLIAACAAAIIVNMLWVIRYIRHSRFQNHA